MDTTMERPINILLLGGTSESSRLADELARIPGIAAMLSLAGRTREAAPSPLPVRSGGFGGVDGLAHYLEQNSVDLVVDATHPFAIQISGNAIAACAKANVPLLVIERPAWVKTAGDIWTEHGTAEAAIAALPNAPTIVFSALGRSSVPLLCAKPQHRYVIRVVDPIIPPPALADAIVIAARGPFRMEDDIALFREHRIACILAKNSGGDAAYAKVEAARYLGLPIHMVQRPIVPGRQAVATCADAMLWIARHQASRMKRGV
jgi:precorrin-6A/cobalt-precorrin-6A reductase